MSAVPLKEREVILLTAALPPRACSYLLKTSSTEGSAAAGAAAGFGAGAGPDMTVAGALLGDMSASRLVRFLMARVGKISMAVGSVGALSPVSNSVDAALADAAMAGVAGHFALAIEHGVVHRHGHRHHAARHVLLALVVLIEMADHVAIAASDAQGRGDVFHRRVNFLGRNAFEHFDLFIELLGGFALHVGQCGRRRRRSSRRCLRVQARRSSCRSRRWSMPEFLESRKHRAQKISCSYFFGYPLADFCH